MPKFTRRLKNALHGLTTADGEFICLDTLITDEKSFNQRMEAILAKKQDMGELVTLLRQSEQKFQAMVEGLSDYAVIFVSTPRLEKIIYINQGYEKIWGRKTQSLYDNPRSFLDLVHPDDLTYVVPNFRNSAETGDWHLSYRIVRDDGDIRYILDTGHPIFDHGEHIGQIGIAIDITDQMIQKEQLQDALNELQLSNEKLEKAVRIDHLTGALNRQAILDEVEKEWRRHRRYNSQASLLFIDLNQFKEINDQYGHLFGDRVLTTIATHLRKNVRDTDFIGRFGGDEFLILLPDSDARQAQQAVDKLLSDNLAIDLDDNHTVVISFSIGIADLSQQPASVNHWLDHADRHMYANKRPQH